MHEGAAAAPGATVPAAPVRGLGAGDVLALLRRGQASTRTELTA